MRRAGPYHWAWKALTAFEENRNAVIMPYGGCNVLDKTDLSQRLSREEWKAARQELELQLGQAQRAAREAKLRTLLVFEGWDAAGKGAVISALAAAWDPRGFEVHNLGVPTADDRYYPFLCRYWHTLPPSGAIAMLNRSWYRRVLDERVDGLIGEHEWLDAYDEIDRFERQLVTDGYLVLKFWLHIDKKEQKRRFEALAKDPVYSWKVGKEERRRRRQWAEYEVAVEDMLARTSTGLAPWEIVAANCRRHARATVMQTVLSSMSRACASLGDAKPAAGSREEKPERVWVKGSNPLDHVDLTLSVDRETYSRELPELQSELRRLQHQLYRARVPAVVVYEGWDASGKGGNIRRLTRELDPRGYEVVPIGAPTPQELAHHYLRRFWTQLPKAGHIAVFDRSWYGRVLVERVEGFASESEWRRAYQEINEFEYSLAQFGAAIVKFWLHISPEEQLRRFEDREADPYKRWKITPEDWRNREKWGAYYDAVGEMVQRTSTSYAPWTIIEGNDKPWARLKALRTVRSALETALS